MPPKNLTFLKITSKSKPESIKVDKSSLHNRRTLFVIDGNNEIFWIFNGNSITDKVKKNVSKISKDYLKEKPNYKAIEVDNEDWDLVIDAIIKNKIDDKIRSKFKIKSKNQNQNAVSDLKKVPLVPKLPRVDYQVPKPKADDDKGGPIIEEFQIAYFDDITKGQISKFDIVVLIVSILDKIQKNEINKKLGKNKIISLVDEFIENL